VRRADNVTTFMWRLSWNLGTLTSWNTQGLSRPVMGLLYLYSCVILLCLVNYLNIFSFLYYWNFRSIYNFFRSCSFNVNLNSNSLYSSDFLYLLSRLFMKVLVGFPLLKAWRLQPVVKLYVQPTVAPKMSQNSQQQVFLNHDVFIFISSA